MRDSSVAPLAVLNPGGRDPFVDYADGPGGFDPKVHAPVNFHAYAAATRGAFFDSTDAVRQDGRFEICLVLLRSRLQPSLDAVKRLKAAGRRVLVAWKECGPAQIAAQLADARQWQPYAEILGRCDGVLSPTLVAPPLLAAADPPPRVHPVATPYPLEFSAWNYDRPLEERAGIFLGTREFFAPARNHLSAVTGALRVARRTGCAVTVINSDRSKGRKRLEAVARLMKFSSLRIVEGALGYDAYLKTMARHRVVFQLDRSGVPGQVAGDALLARMPCVGGNSAIEQLAFPGECHPAMDESDAECRLEALLADDAAWRRSVTESQELAGRLLSYGAVASRLGEIFGGLRP